MLESRLHYRPGYKIRQKFPLCSPTENSQGWCSGNYLNLIVRLDNKWVKRSCCYHKTVQTCFIIEPKWNLFIILHLCYLIWSASHYWFIFSKNYPRSCLPHPARSLRSQTPAPAAPGCRAGKVTSGKQKTPKCHISASVETKKKFSLPLMLKSDSLEWTV